MRHFNLLQRLTDAADLSMEPLPGLPVVEIVGFGRVLIENHQGVREYGPDRIQIKVPCGLVCVLGDRLQLMKMSGTLLLIQGEIRCVELTEGG